MAAKFRLVRESTTYALILLWEEIVVIACVIVRSTILQRISVHCVYMVLHGLRLKCFNLKNRNTI